MRKERIVRKDQPRAPALYAQYSLYADRCISESPGKDGFKCRC